MNIIFDGADNKRIKINFIRAYARILEEVSYKVIQQIGSDFLVVSDWLPDDGYNPHISNHIKSFKLNPESARLFSVEVFAQLQQPSLIPIYLLAKDSKFSFDIQNNRFVFKA